MFEFDLMYNDRKDLAIQVHPDNSVLVKAPTGKSIADVLKRVQRRAAWVVKQQDYFDKFHPLPTEREYVNGETHVYLGRQYLLKVIESERDEVKLVGRYLRVYSSPVWNKKKVGKLVWAWYRDHAQRILNHRLDICLEVALRMGLSEPEVRFRQMRRRWGSCAKSGIITLNTELAKAPVHCIDYVITHELCHQKYKNHSPAFYRLLTKLMPDWEKRKVRLEKVLI